MAGASGTTATGEQVMADSTLTNLCRLQHWPSDPPHVESTACWPASAAAVAAVCRPPVLQHYKVSSQVTGGGVPYHY